MIFDHFSNLGRYRFLGERFAVALDYLAQPDFARLPEGRTDLIPGEVWSTVMRKPARVAEGSQFEVHRRFADIQCCVSGREQMGWHAGVGALPVARHYDEEKDVLMLHGPVTEFLPLQPEWFAVLFPGEPHAPLIGTGELTKVVLKVLIS